MEPVRGVGHAESEAPHMRAAKRRSRRGLGLRCSWCPASAPAARTVRVAPGDGRESRLLVHVPKVQMACVDCNGT
jgi:hypothetical protein